MSGSVAQPSDTGTRLAIERTRLAHERTLMAWVRTATSLISFGFTIYKFFEGLRQAGQYDPGRHLFGPRAFGLTMITTGLVALLLASIQHRRDLTRMRAEFGPQPRSTALVVAGLISILGIAGLIAVLFRQ
jgi:putative membrane protein